MKGLIIVNPVNKHKDEKIRQSVAYVRYLCYICAD